MCGHTLGKHRSSPAPTQPASGSARSRAGRAFPAGPAGSKPALAAPTPRAAPCSPEIRGCSPARRELGQPQTGPGPPAQPRGREETLSPAPRGSGPPPQAAVLRSPLMSLPGRRLPETLRSSRPATSGPMGGDQPAVTPWRRAPRRASPGPGGRRSCWRGTRRRPVTASAPAGVTGLVLSAGTATVWPWDARRRPQRHWKRKGGRQQESEPGPARRAGRRSSALAGAICTQIRADPGKALPQRRHAGAKSGAAIPPGSADDRELSRVQRVTIGRTRQNTPSTINPPAVGPRTSPRLRRGRFRGERLSPRWPRSVSRSGGWRGSDRIPGLSRPPSLLQAPNSCGFAGLDGK